GRRVSAEADHERRDPHRDALPEPRDDLVRCPGRAELRSAGEEPDLLVDGFRSSAGVVAREGDRADRLLRDLDLADVTPDPLAVRAQDAELVRQLAVKHAEVVPDVRVA